MGESVFNTIGLTKPSYGAHARIDAFMNAGKSSTSSGAHACGRRQKMNQITMENVMLQTTHLQMALSIS